MPGRQRCGGVDGREAEIVAQSVTFILDALLALLPGGWAGRELWIKAAELFADVPFADAPAAVRRLQRSAPAGTSASFRTFCRATAIDDSLQSVRWRQDKPGAYAKAYAKLACVLRPELSYPTAAPCRSSWAAKRRS